ncbi:hypothetical protein HN695_03105 [Candidatus Woesearchaeota archaeon]|jgi:DNA repair protein NreA|nr:hypothetical protein [Candidatus Woesearchaeota archaeon]MBT5271765.1 hypothetical protein [Candidatus Woesearchaeota archaeon]MBT6041194.1 hypothetical protein [Candidatus Woesearchaeota archaeon]MBT6336315.1 hypothetical protein [Candidatus Woesearchaeota archaeon]MBT7927299.1 hypothetical protein [Candidatus Woesearchaeota archaeon]
MNISYIKDKGRKLHFHGLDPKKIKLDAKEKFNKAAKQDYFGASPNLFVGKFGYPNINVGIMNVEDYQKHDEPLTWVKEGTTIPKIIDLRTQLINSQFRANIKTFDNKLLEMSQEISLASKPVDVEINLTKKPQHSLTMFDDAMPHGPKVGIKKAMITENPKIPQQVEKAVDDIYFKANDAVYSLYDKGFDEHYLTKVFSLANLGMKKNRKLVPTRWSITAVDDLIGKQIVSEVKDFQTTNYLAYFGGYQGNYYLILMFPEVWSYELFEMIITEQNSFATDYESFQGRKAYAYETAGGYYAARIAILEKLKSIKRQAGVLALRFINPNEYIAPLGVWVCRQATRAALANKPIEFASKELLLNYAKLVGSKKFGFNVNGILDQSLLLRNMQEQMKLGEFF